MSKSRLIFLSLTLFIACSDALFVYINLRNDKQALAEALDNQGRNLEHGFTLSLGGIERTMAMLATYVANDPENQRLFLEGAKAVRAEGGGGGGPRSAELRDLLEKNVSPSWERVTRDFQVRQLQFHLGPGSTSFLRVHRPEKFGDCMDRCRWTVVHTNWVGKSVTGFETGRVISGIRGVVPVFAFDPATGDTVQAGALEAGTSFATILPELARELDMEAAVYLTSDHVTSNMWPEMRLGAFDGRAPIGNYYLEGISCQNDVQIFSETQLSDFEAKSGTYVINLDGKNLAVTTFPLRDFHGKMNPDLPQVGMVVLWQDASHQVAAMERATQTNIFYALLGFLMVESALFFGVKLITRGLNSVINSRTEELRRVRGRLMETARLSGKAEVAVSVLHNVGNVLNSVVTTVGSLRKRAVGSRANGLGRIGEMISDQGENLADYISKDPRGSLLPQYLVELSGELVNERDIDQEDLDRLASKVDHVACIIKQQEKHESVPSVSEEVDLVQILAVAVDMVAEVAARLDVRLVRDSVPELGLEVDRHLVLQILINLLHNGIEAAGRDRSDGKVTLSAAINAGSILRIEITDNGCGWDQETGKRLFTHGFTTKPNGHGLGLHSSWLAARRLQGTLSSFSDGPDRGGRFTLELPVRVLEGSREYCL